MEYKWKPKSMIPVDADVAGNQLETIRQRNNDRLTPAAVVDDAKAEVVAATPGHSSGAIKSPLKNTGKTKPGT